jgi:hypothetical protein
VAEGAEQDQSILQRLISRRVGAAMEIYDEVEAVIQAGMDRLAARRTLPVLG